MNITETIAHQIDKMPMLSAAVSRLIAISGDAKSSIKEMAKVVETDAVLTAKVLKVANSAAFSPPQPIATLNQAIVYLGEKIVMGVAIDSSSSVFSNPLEGYESAAGELWAHSLQTAIAAREMAAFSINKVSPDLAYTAGLLHDIGKSVVSNLFDRQSHSMAIKCDQRQVEDFAAAERDLLGTDHAHVGAELARHWKLPESLRLAIKFHHQPRLADSLHINLVYVVHIADILAMMAGIGTGIDVLSYRMDSDYRSYIKISKNELSRVVLNTYYEFEKSKKIVFAGAEGNHV